MVCTGEIMKLVEYMAKDIFRSYSIPVPDGKVVRNVDIPDDVKYPIALKSQVLTGGRGKAGGIKFANTKEEAIEKINTLLGMDIKGYTVREVLLEPKLEIKRELYLSITIDREAKMPVILACAEGGMEIESVPDDKIFRLTINPLIGYMHYMGKMLAEFYGLEKEQAKSLYDIIKKLYNAFTGSDAELLEINPLVITGDGKLIAGDGKADIDSDSLFRQKHLQTVDQELTPVEKEARDKGIAFVQLDGNIGIIANGAGLTMATIDEVNFNGGAASLFLDLGGTDDPDKVMEALELIVKTEPDVILMNIFGGLTKCDTVATGLVQAMRNSEIKIPLVARIKGANEKEGREILEKEGIFAVSELREAAEKAIEIAGGQ